MLGCQSRYTKKTPTDTKCNLLQCKHTHTHTRTHTIVQITRKGKCSTTSKLNIFTCTHFRFRIRSGWSGRDVGDDFRFHLHPRHTRVASVCNRGRLYAGFGVAKVARPCSTVAGVPTNAKMQFKLILNLVASVCAATTTAAADTCYACRFE